jgi:creatinine amidohydrolase
MNQVVRMASLSWPDYERKIRDCDPAVLIPVGSVEQHGPHLPLATDSLIPTAICELCAGRDGALVAPTLSYGYKSMPRCGGGQHFCGTTSLDASTLIAQIKDIVRDLTRHGVRKIAFVVGHMENQWFVNEACELALREIRMLGMEPPRLMNAAYWEFLTQKTIDDVFGDHFPNWALEHAGIMETSMMMHLHPDLVRLETLTEHGPSRLPVYDMWPYDEALIPADGVLNTARGASAERGQIFFDEFTSSLSDALGREFG